MTKPKFRDSQPKTEQDPYLLSQASKTTRLIEVLTSSYYIDLLSFI